MHMKYDYVLTVNTQSKNYNSCKMKYGHTGNIEAYYSKDYMEIHASIGKKHNLNDMNSYLMNLMKDCIKKISTIHLILYETVVSVHRISLRMDNDDGSEVDLTDSLRLYSLCDRGLLKGITDSLKQYDIVNSIITIQKSNYDSNMAGLYAYLCSKATDIQINRFSFLWMAMNGFYKRKYNLKNDKDSLKEIIIEYGFGNDSLSRDERNKLASSIWSYLLSLNDEKLNEIHNDDSSVSQKIQSILKANRENYQMTTIGFIMTELAYYLRCNIFHGNKPVLFFAFDSDPEIRVLKMISDYLETFLDEHMSEMFINI